jgi:Kef-type K+ transport system membrane component KefB
MSRTGRIRIAVFYTLLLGAFLLLLYRLFVQDWGDWPVLPEVYGPCERTSFWETFTVRAGGPLALLLGQIALIIIVARLAGGLFRKLGQPAVVGEMAAGIALGPSLFGQVSPELFAVVFPSDALEKLGFLSQLGLMLFLFVIGMHLDLQVLRSKARSAVVISHASIMIPFTLGMALAGFLYPEFAGEGMPFAYFALFIGVSLSITAFPVLARMIHERGMHRSRLGALVLTCAAADDITAWFILAGLIGLIQAGSLQGLFLTLGLAVLYIVLMTLVVRPLLRRHYRDTDTKRELPVTLPFVVLMLSSLATEWIGIHALFGAFIAGTVMPIQGSFRDRMRDKVQDVALVMLLPLFFVITGLRTDLQLLNHPGLWGWTALIILVAATGKGLGSALAARITGHSWAEGLTVGALMNTRGLMELVVLHIGFELGVLGPQIFTMLVIMALTTTLMTGPILTLLERLFPEVFRPSSASD